MKTIIVATVVVLLSAQAIAGDRYVKPYIRKDGTYVQGHYKSAPDGKRYNNYSAQGNFNPYTGKKGSADPYALPTISSDQRQQSGYQSPYTDRDRSN